MRLRFATHLLAVGAVGVGVLGAARAAHGMPPRGARLTWARGASADVCVGHVALEEDVKMRLGYDAFALPSALSVEGAVVRVERGFRAELVIRDGTGAELGTRTLASAAADCRSLGEAVAVAITVAIDPEAAGSRVPLAVEEPPAPVPSPSTAALLVPSPHAPVSILVTSGATGGVLPGIAPIVSLRVRRAVDNAGKWELGLGAHFWPESRAAGLGFAMTSAALEMCAVFRPALRWCAGVHGGAFFVAVVDPELAPIEVGMFPWFAGETGPSAVLPLGGPWRLALSAAALVPFTRRQAFLRGKGAPVWEESVVGGRADVGVGLTF